MGKNTSRHIFQHGPLKPHLRAHLDNYPIRTQQNQPCLFQVEGD